MTLWAEELETVSNIKVNSIDPGPVRTSLRRRSHPGESQEKLLAPSEIVDKYVEVLMSVHEFHGQKLNAQTN